jgi:hypothetical protein
VSSRQNVLAANGTRAPSTSVGGGDHTRRDMAECLRGDTRVGLVVPGGFVPANPPRQASFLREQTVTGS